MTIRLDDFVAHIGTRRISIGGIEASLRALSSQETMLLRRHVPRPVPAWTKGPDGEWSAAIGDPAYQRDLAEHRVVFASACVAAGLDWKTQSGAEFRTDGREVGGWSREAVEEVRRVLSDNAIMTLYEMQEEIGGVTLLEAAAGN